MTLNQTNPTAFPTITEISFSTPFVFFPAKGTTGKLRLYSKLSLELWSEVKILFHTTR